MKVVLLCLFFAGAALAETANLNQLVDQLITSVDQVITQANMDSVKINDVSTDWHQRWHFIKVSGNINCHNGYVRHLATLKRTGDVTMTTAGNTVTLHARLGIGSLQFGFDKCQAKVHRLFSVSSKFFASVDSNSLDLQISLTYSGTQCQAKLDNIALVDLGHIHIDIGGNVFKRIMNRLLDMITNHYRGNIKDQINSSVKAKAAEAVTKNSQKLCQKIPH